MAESDAPAVEPLQAARLLIDAEPTSVRTGRVSLVGRRARDNRTDDPDAARRAALVGDQRYHVVEIALDDAAPLFAGARGAARITTYDSTLGENLWRRLRQTFARLF